MRGVRVGRAEQYYVFTCDRVIVVLSSAALSFASLACSLSDKNS